MLIELVPDTYLNHIRHDGPLHVVMHYGATCGPCKVTMPQYEAVVAHFELYNISNIKFYRFHQWEPSYKEFIEQNNLNTNGVPTFRYFYMGDVINEETLSFNDANVLKKHIMNTVAGIESTMGSFDLYAS